MASSQDPFYLVRQEIQELVNETQTKFSKWGGMAASNPDRIKLGADVERGCKTIQWQLDELQGSIEKASINPAKFNLTHSELDRRQAWIRSTKAQVTNMERTVQDASERARYGDPGTNSGFVSQNDKFVNDQRMEQEMVIRRQDEDLDHMEQQVDRLGKVGLTIHEELVTQQGMLDELDEDMDVTTSKMRAAQKKMQEIIKKSGGKCQFCTIIGLCIALIILVVIAFS